MIVFCMSSPLSLTPEVGRPSTKYEQGQSFVAKSEVVGDGNSKEGSGKSKVRVGGVTVEACSSSLDSAGHCRRFR